MWYAGYGVASDSDDVRTRCIRLGQNSNIM